MQSPRNGVILVTMDAILKALTETPSLNTLPLRAEEGCLPALITQVGGAMRAVCAAMLRKSTGRPLAVICPDDASARTLAGDLTALLGRAPVMLTGRDMVLNDTEAVSRQDEQRRLTALDALLQGADAAVITVAGLLQRTLPPESLESAAFTMRMASKIVRPADWLVDTAMARQSMITS